MTDEHKHMDLSAIEAAVVQILKAVGEDPAREGLVDTPRRVARMYAELFAGLHQDPGRHMDVHFDEHYDEMVVLRDIPFHSMCEHHLLPFMGRAHVAYLPRGKVVGVSKLARVVEVFARRPQHPQARLGDGDLGHARPVQEQPRNAQRSHQPADRRQRLLECPPTR